MRIKKTNILIITASLTATLLLMFAAISPTGYAIALVSVLGLGLMVIVLTPITLMGEEFKLWKFISILGVILIMVIFLNISVLQRDIVYFISVLLPILIVQLLYSSLVVKLSLNIARFISLILVYGAEHLSINAFAGGKFIVNAIIVSLVFDSIIISYRAFNSTLVENMHDDTDTNDRDANSS